MQLLWLVICLCCLSKTVLHACVCGRCLSDQGADAHKHVRECKLNSANGNLFGTPELFNKTHNARKKTVVLSYLASIVDAEVRTQVKLALKRELLELGIAA